MPDVGWGDEQFEPVLGHMCDGLKDFQSYEARAHCVPNIDAAGVIVGCDDSATGHPIKFCPFCGVRLGDETKV